MCIHFISKKVTFKSYAKYSILNNSILLHYMDYLSLSLSLSHTHTHTHPKHKASFQCINEWYINYFAAAAAAKSLQSCPTLWDPKDDSPPGSPVPGILQPRILEWVAISFSNKLHYSIIIYILILCPRENNCLHLFLIQIYV